MAIESACIPCRPRSSCLFSGYRGVHGSDEPLAGGLAGAVGCVLGSLVAYWVGMYGVPLHENTDAMFCFPSHLDMVTAGCKAWRDNCFRQSPTSSHTDVHRVPAVWRGWI